MQTPMELDGRLHTVLDDLQVIIWVADAKLHNLRFLNRQAGTLLGRPIELWLKQASILATLLPPEDWERLKEAARTALDTRQCQRLEHRMLDSEQKVHWFRTELHPLASEAGSGSELAGAMVDISEDHQATAELEHTRQRYAEVIDSVEGIVWELDPSTFRFVLISKAAERLLGYPCERWLQEPGFWQSHLHPEDRDWAMNFCRIRFSEGRDHDFEYRMLAANGAVVWIRDIVTVIMEAGKPSRMRGVMMDVTANKKAQEALEQSLSLLQATLESTEDGILAVDRDGHATIFNRRFLEMWKIPEQIARMRSQEVLLAHAFNQVLEPEPFLSRVREINASAEAESLDILKCKDGRVFERYSRPQWIGGKIVGRVWGFRDITARRKAEHERSQLLCKAQEALRVRDDFLSIASHELKTPLTPLALRLRMIEHALELGQPPDPSWVSKAMSHLAYLTSLINDLLDVSRIEAGQWKLEWEKLSLRKLVQGVMDEFQLVSPQHRLELEQAGGELTVEADPSRLEQVVTNLLDNAIKYSPDGGIVHVQVIARGPDALLSVSDQGIGIPAAQQARLFERFFRAGNAPARQFSGLGLGLYISRRIVEAHGGRIGVQSEQGQGATFFVRLPLVKQAARAERPPATPHTPA